MSLIEKAARRLDELRRAGIEVPAPAGATGGGPDSAVIAPERPTALLREAAGGQDSPFLTDARLGEGAPTRASRMVEVDLGRLSAEGYVTPDAPRSQLADEYRVIKRPLLNNAHGKSAAPVRRANLIMVTSSVPGEGKTFTSINLALSIAAEVDSTVLLVDADVARPAVLNRLGLPSSPGLLDLLTQPDLDMTSVLLKTNIDRLSILPAGTSHARATELLASAAMNRLLDEVATRYADRIIVFDAPPLLLSTESRALATQVGQVLMVVEADRTSQSAVMTAMGMLEACPVVMTVLNKMDASQSGDGYYGQYGEYGAE